MMDFVNQPRNQRIEVKKGQDRGTFFWILIDKHGEGTSTSSHDQPPHALSKNLKFSSFDE